LLGKWFIFEGLKFMDLELLKMKVSSFFRTT